MDKDKKNNIFLTCNNYYLMKVKLYTIASYVCCFIIILISTYIDKIFFIIIIFAKKCLLQQENERIWKTKILENIERDLCAQVSIRNFIQ